MASIRKVARDAGVSIATVSRVINGSESVAEELRQRVFEAVKRCDYVPTTGRRSLDTIALVYLGAFTVASPYDSACLEGITEEMRETRYDLRVCDLRRDLLTEEPLSRFFRRRGISGAIVRCSVPERDWLRSLVEASLPLVVLGDHFQHEKLEFIYSDSSVATRQAMEHLTTLGHRRVAFAACVRDDGDHLDRFAAYRDVLAERGLYDDRLVYRLRAELLDGAQLVRNLMGVSDRPTAMFIADPLVAVGAMNEALRMGVRIPHDLSIVGFDDTETRCLMHPRMTAVCQDSKALGKAAFRRAMALAECRTFHREKLEAWFEVNNTTAPPPEKLQLVLPDGSRIDTTA